MYPTFKADFVSFGCLLVLLKRKQKKFGWKIIAKRKNLPLNKKSNII